MSLIYPNPATPSVAGIVKPTTGLNVAADGTTTVAYGTSAVTAAAGNDNRIVGAEQVANKNVASGYAGLDSNGKILLSTVPSSLVGGINFQGTWNASTNTPALTSGTGTKGFLYRVNVAGTTTLDGITQWNVGDDAVFDGTVWSKLDGLASEVVSVAGRTGAVVLTAADVSGLATVATTGSYTDLLNKPAAATFASNTYTAAGAIAPTDDESVINTSGAVTMTLAAGAAGHLVAIKRYGVGAVTISANIDGTSQSIVLNTSAAIRECLTLRYNGALSTWLAS